MENIKIMPPKKTTSPSSTSTAAGKYQAWAVYVVGFVLLFIFCTLIYGEVFAQIAAENFVCADAYANDQDWALLYYMLVNEKNI